MKRGTWVIVFWLVLSSVQAQSGVETILRGGEIIVNGLSFIKSSKNQEAKQEKKTLESICIKNKLDERITVVFMHNTEDGDTLKRELVIPKDGKECVLEVPKGVYLYEIILPNKEVYKKGEYRFQEDTLMTIK